MKQRFQHIILLIILALAWSGETWGAITKGTITYDNWYNDVTPSKGNGVGFYVCSVNTKNFLSASNRSMSSADNATLFYWVSSGSKLQSTYDGTTYHLNVGISDQSVTTGGTNTASTIEFKSQDGYYAIGGGYWLINNSGTSLDRKAKTGSNYQQSKWYVVSTDQYNRFKKLKNEYIPLQTNAVNAIVNYSTDNLPDTYYNNLLSAIKLSLSLTNSTTEINNAYNNLKSLHDNLATVSEAYLTAKNTTLPGKQTQSNKNSPSGIADSDINDAYTALEQATSVTAINNAVAKVKNFDAITLNNSYSIEMGGTQTNIASATSNRAISYTSSNSSILSVIETTLTGIAPGVVTVTASTGSTEEGYYRCDKNTIITVLPVFNFEATASSNNDAFGTAEASVLTKIVGDLEQVSESATATFTATAADGCTFIGWYEEQDYSGSPISTKQRYEVSLDCPRPGATATKTLFALFKKRQNLQWENEDLDLGLVNGTTGSSAATVTSGKTITYHSSNTSAVIIDTDGTIHAVGLGKSTVTASVEGDDTYNAESLTRVFTVGEKKQATFTPEWGEGTSTDIKVGTSTTIGLTNIATDATFTISANPTAIVSWTREGNTLTINGNVAGTTELTLSQTGNTFLYGNTAKYTITVSKYANTFTLAAQEKTMEVDEVWSNVVTGTGNNNTQVSYSNTGVATYDASTNKITAQAEGTTTITFTQAATSDHEGTTKTVDITVNKVANPLNISLPSQEVTVGNTIDLTITGQDSDADITATITDSHQTSSVNNGTDVISYANGVIIGKNAGTAKIQFRQAATNKYTSYTSETYEITVSKNSNNITFSLAGGSATAIKLKYGASATLSISSSNTESSPVVNRVSGSFTTYSSGKITAGNTAGTDLYEISQSETYMYESAYASFTVRVNNTDEEVGYVLNDATQYSHGTGSGTVHTYELSGPGETLYYSARTDWSAIYYNLFVEYSSDNENWTEAQNNQSLNDGYKNFSCSIPESARYVRFRFPAGGTLSKYIKNVYVPRKTYVRASSDIEAFGSTYTDQTKTATITVDYSTTNGGNIHISSNNTHFAPSKTELTTSNHSDSQQTFTVTYTPDPDQLGEESAVITVGDLFYSTQVTLTATAQKYSTTITRGINTETATIVDGEIDNVFAFSGTSASEPSASSEDNFYYAISHTQTSAVNNGTGVISYNPKTNIVKGLNAGTARLTIYQKKTDLYNATSQTFDFTVTKLANKVGFALSTTTMNVDGTATVEVTKDDSKGAVTAIFSNVAYVNESQNREGGLLSYTVDTKTITGVNAGTGTVTVTQAETYKYVSKSVEFNVTVNKLPQTLTWDDDDLETTMQVGSTLEGNTATSVQGLTPVTYASSNTSAITVDANTGVLTAQEIGANIGITALQAGNYKYAPASLTRFFSVFNKKTPAFNADSHFNGATGRIEFSCTATITVTSVSDGDDFTITNGDNTIIDVVRDGETITITGLAVGSTTLTLAQQDNENFIAKTLTYNITVFWPDDFLMLAPMNVPTYTPGDFRKVFFERTLPAGYSSLALPFSTTVATLTGRAANADDWVAQLETVTYSQADGYTLYFNKVSGGDITANQPYILHLAAEVVNPVWTNVTLSAATATEITASAGYGNNVDAIGIYSDWSMTSNFEVGMSMNGKYGVVNNAGGLKKGGSSATLNAFSAYITPPTGSAGIKVRSAFTDEFGETTYINGLPDEDATASDSQLYDLSGRRVNAHQPKSGIYVINGRRIVVK